MNHSGADEGVGTREAAVASHTRTLVVCPYSTARVPSERGPTRSPEARREEAVWLALAIELNVVDSTLVVLNDIRPATYLGKGKVAELAERIAADKIDLVVVDSALSPVQQRNLEKQFKAKVIDRTGLILEIFGRRARTAEGVLQVELAHDLAGIGRQRQQLTGRATDQQMRHARKLDDDGYAADLLAEEARKIRDRYVAVLDHQQFASRANLHIYGHICTALQLINSFDSTRNTTCIVTSATHISIICLVPPSEIKNTNNRHHAFLFPTADSRTFIHNNDDIIQAVRNLRNDTETSCRAD